jgi:DnaA N-terminal domain
VIAQPDDALRQNRVQQVERQAQLPLGIEERACFMLANDPFEELAVSDACHTSLVCLWNRVLNSMQVQMSRHEFKTWVRRTSLLSIANGVATIGTPSAFFKEGFENRYTGIVRSLISALYVPVSQVRVVITGVSDQGANGLP